MLLLLGKKVYGRKETSFTLMPVHFYLIEEVLKEKLKRIKTFNGISESSECFASYSMQHTVCVFTVHVLVYVDS